MKNIILCLLFSLFLFSCKNKEEQSDKKPIETYIPYEIINSDITEYGNKIRYKLDLVVLGDEQASEEELRHLLYFFYNSSIENNSDNPAKTPNVFDIKIYESKEHLQSGMAQWIGWLSKAKNDTSPDIYIHLPKIVAEQNIVTRLEESQRKTIWYELINSQDKAIEETEKKNLSLDAEKRLMKQYREKLINRYKITEEELSKISTEAADKNWPFP
ncbi:hypothetical protein [Myroides sp. N17-2]|uniref:hypothetical protein n=1 Tax=Myroides sp. N17-2 TaxID=2030799 RepID=UPI000EFC81AB|nr:hypothetical protein [Myroides sp. N17-2]